MYKRSFLWHLLALLANKFGTIVLTVDNNVIFERFVCGNPNTDAISLNACEMKPIAPNMYRMNLSVHIIQPLDNIWVYFVVYQRFSSYQKFVYQWEDVCGYFRNESKAPIFKVLFDNLKRFSIGELNLQCPIANDVVIAVNKFNMSHFVLPLLPAARYRVDLNITQGRNKRHIGFAQVYFRISDFRLWQ